MNVKRWKSRRRTAILALASWSICGGLATTGCSKPTESTADSGVLADLKGGWPDSDPVPGVYVSFGNPYHLMTALPADFKGADRYIRFDLGLNKVDEATAISQLQSAFSLMTRETKQPVQGVWTFDWQGNRFVPSTLTNDTEYLIQIKKIGYLIPSREFTAFRVGSLPRIALIEFFESDSNATEVDRFGIRFSEPVDVAKVGTGLKVQTTGAGAKALATKVTTPLSISPTWQIAIQLPAGTSTTTKLSITLGTDVGAPTNVKLDGKYTGVANSGPFTVELLPKDYLGSNSSAWEPSLSF